MGMMMRSIGLDLRQFRRGLVEWPQFVRDYARIRSAIAKSKSPFPIRRIRPCLHDRSDSNGVASGHYFHQDLMVARRILETAPKKHVDVGSRVDGFVAHVAVFRPIEVLDIRPQTCKVRNISFGVADLSDENFPLADYCDSLSCLHAIEHFGLGRYGDPIDPQAHERGMKNLHKCLQTGGRLFLSTPIGPQRIEFNAHRVFSVDYLIQWLRPKFEIAQFSYVDDAGDLHENVELTPSQIASNFGCRYGCGIFELIKR